MPDIEFSFFGPPHIARDGMPVPTQRRKSLALLAYLAVTQQNHARDTLTAIFWPDTDQSHGRAVLRNVLADLHRALGPDALVVTGDQVALRRAPDMTIDVLRFRELVAQVTAHHRAGAALCDDCLNALSKATGLYRADFLAGFTLSDALEFDEWQTYQTETLRLELAEVLEKLAHGLAQARRFADAIAYARRWLALDPLNELSHRCLIELFAHTGDHSAAKRQYEGCVRVLREELGITPEEATTALYRAAVAGSASSPSPSLALTHSATPAHNLPPDLTPFIGREAELAQLAERLADPACHLLTVIGPGGIGKTRLAIQAARNASERFAHRACFVDLAPLTSADFLSAAILQALHAPRPAIDPDDTLLDYLADKRLLLVLDNYEHLLSGPDEDRRDGYGLVTKLVEAAPYVKLLITSRSRLNVTAEWLAPLEGMQTPPTDEWGAPSSENAWVPATSEPAWLETMPEDAPAPPDSPHSLAHYSAAALFLACARRLRPNLEPTGDEARIIGRICRLLGGVPLGIELAAAWTRTLSLAEIASRLERGLDLLTNTARDAIPRHRSMTAAFDYSWRLLSSRERSILRQMAVFVGGCTGDAAEAVTGATLLDLAGLADKSWLRVGPAGGSPEASGRYSLHELIRQYCAAKLTAEHECETGQTPDHVHDRHTNYYLGRLRAQGALVTDWQDRFVPLLSDLDNYNALWRRAIEGNRFETLGELFTVVGYIDGSARTQLQLLEQAHHALRTHHKTSEATAQASEAAFCLAELLRRRAGCCLRLGQLTRAAADIEAGLSILNDLPQTPGAIEARFRTRALRAFVLEDSGHYAAAIELRHALLAELPDNHAMLWPYQPDRALTYWQAEITSVLFHPFYRLGQYAEAERSARQALQWFAAMPWACNANALANLGLLHYVRGEYAEALRLGAESLRANRAHGQQGHSIRSLLTMAQAEVALGRPADAAAHTRQALATARACDRPIAIVQGMIELAELELSLGRPSRAKELYADALACYEQNGLECEDVRAIAWIGLGRVACATGDAPAAGESFVRALRCHGCFAVDQMDALAGLAQVRAIRGDRVSATELLAFILAHPFTSHRTRQPSARLLAELEVGLSPEAFAAAVERGRARQVDEVVALLLNTS